MNLRAPLLCLAGLAARSQDCPFPSQAGTQWIYRVTAVSGVGRRTIRRSAMRRMRILDAAESRGYKMALVENFILDVLDAWHGDRWDQTPARKILVWTPEGQLHALPSKAGERLDRLPDPTALLARLVPATVVLRWPLGQGTRFAIDADTPAAADPSECRWSWNLQEIEARPRDIPGWHGKGQGFVLIHRTNPDHQTWTFVPGLGAAAYAYSHHGSVEEIQAALVRVHFPPPAGKDHS